MVALHVHVPDSWSNLNLEMLVFEERGKPQYPEKNFAEQGKEPTTNSTHIWRRRRDLNQTIFVRGVYSYYAPSVLAPLPPFLVYPEPYLVYKSSQVFSSEVDDRDQ